MKTSNNKLYNLSAKEAFKLLQSEEMANYISNITLTKPTRGGNHHGGRKSGSKNNLTLKSLDSKIDKLAKTVDDLAKIVQDGFARQEQRWVRQEQFNKEMLQFQEFVLKQFQKHGWTK